jgi:dTDP-4-dehydrorhamnose 3,5-epimerase
MKVLPTPLPGILLLEPRVFTDERGLFFESYNRKALQDLAGIDTEFVQDNHSCSGRGVIRGLHYQIRQPQGKLVRVVAGSVLDITVDIRRGSPTFGCWFRCELSAQNRRMLWIPPGFAHGFASLMDGTEFLYKVTDYWAAAHERTILWNDPQIGIEWPPFAAAVVSAKDRMGVPLSSAEVFPE